MDSVAICLKDARVRALSTLIRILGDFDLAEEAAQESAVRAVSDWRQNGVPDNPVAWLVQTGRRYALDIIQHQRMAKRHHVDIQHTWETQHSSADMEAVSALHLQDDMIRLIFTCCHPSLSTEAQVALTLKVVAGFETRDIARAFLLTAKTMEQRLTRAKRKIKAADIDYQVPHEKELPERLSAAQKVVYLIYNQSYTQAHGHELLDKYLAESAIHISRTLCRLYPGDTESMGLLALLLMQHARAATRTDDSGMPIPLEKQDRGRWNQVLIDEGMVLIEKCFLSGHMGSHMLQAAIASVHNTAWHYEETDWQKIIHLYTLLEQLHPSPVVTLNRAVALARGSSLEEGLKLIETLATIPAMQRYQYFHSTRAALLEENGDRDGAIEAYKQALSICQNQSEEKFLADRIGKLEV